MDKIKLTYKIGLYRWKKMMTKSMTRIMVIMMLTMPKELYVEIKGIMMAIATNMEVKIWLWCNFTLHSFSLCRFVKSLQKSATKAFYSYFLFHNKFFFFFGNFKNDLRLTFVWHVLESPGHKIFLFNIDFIHQKAK